MRRLPELQLPAPPRWPRLAIAASVALHLLLFRFGPFNGWVPVLRPPVPAPIVLQPLPLPADLALPAAPLVSRPSSGAKRPAAATAEAAGRAAAVPSPGSAVSAPFAPPTVAASPTLTPADTGSERGGHARRIAPELANGKLWVEPMLLPPKELAARMRRTHAELVDSASTAAIQAFLDSIEADPASKGLALPSWTTTLAGKKFGLDSRNIYIAGLKIPAAVLALLPMPHGNESHAFDRSGWLYADLRAASQRAANVEEFKRAIREIRDRKESERAFARNQRTPPSENAQ